MVIMIYASNPRSRTAVFGPDSLVSQHVTNAFVSASTWAHIQEQIPEGSKVEFCPLFQTAINRLNGAGDPPEWKRKRERILFAELLEEIPDLEEPSEEDEEWWKKKMLDPRWERWDGHTEEWALWSMIDGEAINIWRYSKK